MNETNQRNPSCKYCQSERVKIMPDTPIEQNLVRLAMVLDTFSWGNTSSP